LSKAVKETPLMAQYNRIKAKHPDALLLFRVGDFYETFGSDAVTAARVLGIVLTKRGNGSATEVELAGFPHHALDTYLPKLVRAGLRVAICDQLEDPKLAKTVVKRGVTEMVTPGVTMSEQLLDHKKNNYLAALYLTPSKAGLALLDASTGDFKVAEGDIHYVKALTAGYKPAELLLPRHLDKAVAEELGRTYYTYPLDDWVFTAEFARQKLTDHFQTQSLKGFGIDDMPAAVIAAGAVMHYMSETEHGQCAHVAAISRIVPEGQLLLDRFTVRNLELLEPTQPGGVALIDVLDKTISPMGARLLRQWLLFPLCDRAAIEMRLDAVTHFYKDEGVRELFARYIKPMGDAERLVSRVAMRKAGPRDMAQVRRTLDGIMPLMRHCTNVNVSLLRELGALMNPLEELSGRIGRTLVDEPPAQLGKGETIARGVSEELDELRDLRLHSKERLTELQNREAQRTGINSLKVGYNNVFGYYLEVTHAHKPKIPADWIRKQTLTNAERYVTEELKQYEEKILGAEERLAKLEAQLFDDLVTYAGSFVKALQRNARVVAQLDCLVTLGTVAVRHAYCRPEMKDEPGIRLTGGRHPVIEKQLPFGEAYVPNDLVLEQPKDQVIVITGPNMSGKSAYLRQAALITLMAQAGSYVPAERASIGIVDRVFSRVGASDNITSGESTFMVEMIETASILNNLSSRSLILMDEIGRGTSTYDGISIAWAIAEFLHNHEGRPLTLFATHYHELTDLADRLPRVSNAHVSTKEVGKKVIFLRKVVPGGSTHSFGIHVASMAGVPKAVVDRANVILQQLEQKSVAAAMGKSLKELPQTVQMSIFETESPEERQVIASLKELDLNGLTPIEALMRLNEWQKQLGGGS
jgi:DNA mismatch repair protein MutS